MSSGLTSRSRRRRPRPPIDREALRYFVYRLHDAEGRVLYVGRSSNPAGRIREHHREATADYLPTAARKALWFVDVRSVSMTGPYTWDGAIVRERDEIERFQPSGNIDLTARDRRPAVAHRSARRSVA